ncbi:MAG: recombination mediator RecR [Desulfobacterales bacterium]|jgi:recombination protein RecR|nr:recombination mediator RecR [Desulfobacterales bacterium]
MNHYPPSMIALIKNFSKLPGIGEKTAERLAVHILRSSREAAEALSQSIMDVKDRIRLCRKCFSLSDAEQCRICSDTGRDAGLLCVVEQQGDMASIEKAGAFGGLYHVLCGVLSPMDGVGPDDIRIRELIDRVREGGVREVVLATGTNLEGETTATFIAEKLAPYPVKMTRIATGVPVGGDLKYVDQMTLKKAMEARHGF